MENLTVFKLITDNEFIPTMNYEIIVERKHHKINCINGTTGGWYFSSALSQEKLQEIFDTPFTRIKSETGTFRINNLERKFLSYTGSRDS